MTEQNKRWQDGRFYLTPMYKYGLHKIIAEHKKLPPRVKGTAQIILGLFGDTPSFPHNLEELARECGVTDNTFRKYREIMEEFGIFGFDVPPYWRRKQTQFETATTIRFPTKRVEKWLRDKGFLPTTRKTARCSPTPDQQFDESNAHAAGTSSQPPSKNDPRTPAKEPVSTKRLTPLEAAPTSPRSDARASGASPTAAAKEEPSADHDSRTACGNTVEEEDCVWHDGMGKGFVQHDPVDGCVDVMFKGRVTRVTVASLWKQSPEARRGELGAEFYDDEAKEDLGWIGATTEPNDVVADTLAIGTRVMADKELFGTVLGFFPGDAPHVLVRWTLGDCIRNR